MELDITEIGELDYSDDYNNVEDIGYVENNVFVPSQPQKPILKSSLKAPQTVPMPSNVSSSLQPPAKKKQVTYDDILSSLNMTVVNGKLQIVRNRTAENVNIQNQNQSQNQIQNQNIQSKINSKATNNYNQIQQQFQQQRQQPQIHQQQQQRQIQQQQQQQQQEQFYDRQYEEPEESGATMTREQYKRLVLVQYLKNDAQRKRINEVKSKKMMFSNNNNHNITSQTMSSTDLNRLFRFAN